MNLFQETLCLIFMSESNKSKTDVIICIANLIKDNLIRDHLIEIMEIFLNQN